MNILGGQVQRRPYVREQEGQLICMTHNQQINCIIQDPSIDFSEIFLCQRCFDNCGSARKIISLSAALNQISDLIRQKTQKFKTNRIYVMGLLEKLQQQLNNYKSDLFEAFMTIEQQIDDWIKFTNAHDVITTQTLLEQLESYHSNTFDFSEQISKFIEESSNYQNKVEVTYERLWNYETFQSQYKKIIFETQQQLESLSKQQNIIYDGRVEIDSPIQQLVPQSVAQTLVPSGSGKITLESASRIIEKDIVFSIAFNKTGTLMVTGLSKDIKIWALINGKLEYQKTLTGHRNNVTCLQFSKNYNQFISGSADSTIKSWKQISLLQTQALLQTSGQLNWNKYEPDECEKHCHQVTHIILNKKEDEMFTCSFDSYIKVWKVYAENNQFFHEQNLPIKHYDHILSMSLNQSETMLVSCGERDKMIILWIKNRDGNWEYGSCVNRLNFGYRLGFINDTQFLWAQHNNSTINCFTISGRTIIEEEKLDIQLEQRNTQGDFYLFPTVYNENKKIFLFKHGTKVYIIKQKSNGFSIEAQLNCGSLQNFGTLTDDGKWLALYKNGEINIYNIN